MRRQIKAIHSHSGLLGRFRLLFHWLAVASPTVAVLAASSASASTVTPITLSGVSSAKVLGELHGVAITSSGVLAIGTRSNYLTNPPCGQALSELSGAGGWQAEYAAGRAGSLCAWRSAVAADPRGGAWAVGYTIGTDGLEHALTEHFNGRSWSVVPSPSPGRRSELAGVIVAPNHQVWAVGQYQERSSGITIGYFKTLTMVYTGSGWRIVPSPSPNTSPDTALQGVTVSSSSRVWAVGWYTDNQQFSRHTLTMMYSSGGWQLVPSPSPGTDTGSHGNILNAVARTPDGGLWAVGSYVDSSSRVHTLTMRYGPGGWTSIPSPSPGRGDADLRAVLVTPGGAVWTAGYFTGRRCGRTLTERFAGGSWQIVHSPNPICSLTRANALNALAVDRRGVLYAVGDTNIDTLIVTNSGSGWHIAAS
jgi:hypothetical protein